MSADSLATLSLFTVGAIVWIAVAISQHRARRKPPPRWRDVPPCKKPWPKHPPGDRPRP